MDPVENFVLPEEILDIIKRARAESYIIIAAAAVGFAILQTYCKTITRARIISCGHMI